MNAIKHVEAKPIACDLKEGSKTRSARSTIANLLALDSVPIKRDTKKVLTISDNVGDGVNENSNGIANDSSEKKISIPDNSKNYSNAQNSTVFAIVVMGSSLFLSLIWVYLFPIVFLIGILISFISNFYAKKFLNGNTNKNSDQTRKMERSIKLWKKFQKTCMWIMIYVALLGGLILLIYYLIPSNG